MTVTFTKHDVGCYADSSRGYSEQGLLIQQLACEYGMENFEREFNPKSEYFDDAVNEAIEYLNTLVSPGLVWEFNDGDFGLYQIESEAQ